MSTGGIAELRVVTGWAWHLLAVTESDGNNAITLSAVCSGRRTGGRDGGGGRRREGGGSGHRSSGTRLVVEPGWLQDTPLNTPTQGSRRLIRIWPREVAMAMGLAGGEEAESLQLLQPRALPCAWRRGRTRRGDHTPRGAMQLKQTHPACASGGLAGPG